MSPASRPPRTFTRSTRDSDPLTKRRRAPETGRMPPDPTLSPRALRLVACAIAAVVVVEIVATPFLGRGLDHLRGVNGGYVPTGDLVVDACIAAIALVVT